MVSRNLTEVFILMRNNSMTSRQIYNDQTSDSTSDRVALINKRRPLVVEEDIELGGDPSRDSSEFLSIPPPWIDDLEDIRYNTTLISQKTKELDQLQTKHVQRPTFDDDATTEHQIEDVTQSITRLFSTCHRIVQQMQGKGQRSSWSEKKLKESVIKSVIQSLQELSTSFRSSQGTYLRKITAREEMSDRYFEIPNLIGEEAGPYRYDQDFLEGNVHKNQEWTQQQLLALEDDNVHLQEREREVQQVVKSIMDLNTIFRELASMVKEQADMVDRIDYHVETTHIKVEEGTKQLQKAANYQRRNRKCIFLVSCVILTVLLIFLLVALGT
ncbi:syntaxin-16 [Folsomia candida]|uniref:Syntaxin-16 n=1 Tax=Folsomia candida TaxID=158441 RepID=A0A226ETU7_FOLCA|nr:syntaxin-16 [Folsomia candida]OXA60660.1 Syntaxin-16 [Folsomia candida]